MRRDLARLSQTSFDLLVIGGGIHGACAAWDAALRGLSVALIDQGDFGAATSANSLGIVHGGLRYLARGDLPRALESIRERSVWLRIAPALVEPLPVLVPTLGRGQRGPFAFRAALALNDLLSLPRNRELSKPIPRGRVISRAECLARFPGFALDGRITGGAIWYDARLIQPERLTFSVVRAAAGRGAAAANYVRVERLTLDHDAVSGASVRDQISGASFDIRARTTLLATGHWTGGLVREVSLTPAGKPYRSHALGVNVVLRKRLADVAVGIQARSGRDRDPVCGGHRYLFLSPNGPTTTLGTWYATADPTRSAGVAEMGARQLVRELVEACPPLELDESDIVRWQSGWLPLKSGAEPGRPDALAERPRVLDHRRSDGIRHLLSVEGVKFTTARFIAQRAIDLVFRDLDRQSPDCRTEATPLEAGSVPQGQDVVSAVRDEMAVKLSDLVFRRAVLGTPPGPDRAMVQDAARRMGAELGWDSHRQATEVEEVMRQIEIPARSLEAVG
jgi:glycerol-3-phosphate dehydrogenase